MRWGAHYAVEGCAGGNISGGIHPAPQTVEKGVFTPWPPLRGGSARRRWGRELYGCPKYFGLWQGSLPPPLRGTAPPLAQAPPPPYRGSLSRRGRFFDTLDSPFWWAVFCFKQPAHKAHDTIVYFANAAGGLRGENDRSRSESPFCCTL